MLLMRRILALGIILTVTLSSFFSAPHPALAAESNLRLAGAAKIDITPDYPVRLSGYGSRKTEFESVAQHIFAKALALGSDAEGPALIITIDNCGISAAIRQEVLQRLQKKTHLTEDHFCFCSSHTHSAPMINGVLPNLFGQELPADQLAHIDRYTQELINKLEQVALAALSDRRPARLDWAVGKVEFAKNRRTKTPTGYINSPNPDGVVDHDLPVLRVTDEAGKVRAILVEYACHCTTAAFNKIHGDWAGCAQAALERDFPGAIALTALGCGGDQNPYPRGTYELAEEHGQALAAEVKRLVSKPMTPLTAKLVCQAKQIALPFDTLPTREEWEKKTQDKNHAIAFHAQRNLARLEHGEKLPTQLPYQVTVWNFGNQLAMVFLPGEVVVDYSLRLKKEFAAGHLWVNAYANDAPCYIPSARVLAEGGYEAYDAMLYYDRPTRFASSVEDLIISAVHDLMPKGF